MSPTLTAFTMLLVTTASLANAAEPEAPTNGQKTFVLIHGSWHSAWNWFRVAPMLRQLGHEVVAPDLPAMGRDKTPLEDVTFQLVNLESADLQGRPVS